MFLREIKEVKFLKELDGHDFETAFDAFSSAAKQGLDAVKVDKDRGRVPKDTVKRNRLGNIPEKDVDLMLRPVILMTIGSISPSEQLIKRSIESSIRTPEQKQKAEAELDTALDFVQYLRVQLIRGLQGIELMPTIMKRASAGSVQDFVERVTERGARPEAIEKVIKLIGEKKETFADALMRRSDASRFNSQVIANFEKNVKDFEDAPTPALLDAFILKMEIYVAFLREMEENLEQTKRLIAGDREIDKVDASA